MLKNFVLLLLIFSFSSVLTFSQNPEKRRYEARRISSPITVDGVFDEKAWESGEWQGDFTQHEPYEGRKPRQKTEFKLLFDNDYLYLAIKAYDTAPDSIINRMTRRDDISGDNVGIIFDSYHDLLSGFSFSVSSTGVRGDEIFSNDGNNEDNTWDPIWMVKTRQYDWGYAAEFKIPFTQLRFKANSSSVWGLEVFRYIHRYNELSLWQPVPRNASGLIHFFGELDGLQDLKPKKQFDITPYAVGGIETYPREEGNPFSKGRHWVQNVGIDGKVGVTNNMTLDFTINPDFGQVEADPSEVNLTAFEIFFKEKRPFFIEGKNITSLGVGLGDGDLGNDNLFYSRRIGRRPQRDLDLKDDEYADIPKNTTILGAAKLTGKTENGWSVGIIESVTSEEKAKVDLEGIQREEIVEPLTNYFVARVQKDINKGNTVIGGMYTNVSRKLDPVLKDEFHQSANTAGIDFRQYFKNKTWTLTFSQCFSNVYGTQTMISNTQQSSIHYFQRPNADYVKLDESRRSLTGQGGNLTFGKVGGHWNFLYLGLWQSPGLELNDAGYLRVADQFINVLWTGYHITEPRSFYQRVNFNFNTWNSYDFGLNYLGTGFDLGVFTKLKNYWSIFVGSNFNSNGTDNTLLRGGPSMKVPGNIGFHYEIQSDDRKKLNASFFHTIQQGFNKSSNMHQVSLDLTYHPVTSLSISAEPSFLKETRELQFIDNPEYQNTTEYLFGKIHQELARVSLRINYTITPDLTIQYWGQPFVTAASFSKIKVITNPLATDYGKRFYVVSPNQMIYNAVEDNYAIDMDANGKGEYNFGNPNFNFDEFLSNLVVRWEFLPGSTVYFVWSQKRDYSSSLGEFKLNNDVTDLFTSKKPYNVFMVKFSYRIGIH